MNSKSSQTYASGAIQAQPTDSSFTLKNSSSVNGSGNTYVAYLFAHDAGGFGDDGSESIIKCGSYTGNGGSSEFEVNLGFEAQWVLVKASDNSTNWILFDAMRGMSETARSQLYPNLSDAEFNTTANAGLISSARGFKINLANTWFNNNGTNYIYIAIRRPMKTPESGTEVFGITPQDGTDRPTYKVPFVADMAIRRNTAVVSSNIVVSRLQGDKQMDTENTSAESAYVITGWDYMDGWGDFGSSLDTSTLAYMFQRATGFFDVVAYTGTGAAMTIPHNLGVVPEIMIVKRRDSAGTDWRVYTASTGTTPRS